MKAREMTTIAAPRADWMLWRMHYLRVIGPLAMVAFGTFLTVWVAVSIVARVQGIEQVPTAGFDLLAIVLGMFLALPTGAAVFSRPFKEQHVLLFHALPVSRLRQWALLVTSSALALLTVYAGFLLLRPNILSGLSNVGDALLLALVVSISFAMGLCFALVFLRTFAVYLAAYVAAVILPLLIVAGLAAPLFAFMDVPMTIDPVELLGGSVEMIGILPKVLVGAIVVWLIGGLTAASAYFYVRGEMTLPRVQVRNLAILLAGAVVTVAAAPIATYVLPRPRLEARRSQISRDGRVLFTHYTHSRTPWRSRLRVVDLTSGATNEWDASGIMSVHWTDRGELLSSWRNVSPFSRVLYLRSTGDRIERWSKSGTRLGSETHSNVLALMSISRDRGLAVVADGEVTRAWELQDGMRSRELFNAPRPDRVTRLGPAHVMFEWRFDEPRMWNVDGDVAREIPRVPIASTGHTATVFDGAFYVDRTQVIRKIEDAWPAPRINGDRVGYSFWQDAKWVFAVVAQPSKATASLYLLDMDTKRWKRITDRAVVSALEIPRAEVSFYDLATAMRIVFGTHTGYALYVEAVGDGKMAHRLFDAKRDVTTTVYERAADDPRRILMRTTPLLVPPASVISIEPDFGIEVEVLWQDGRFTPLKRNPGTLQAIWPDGTQVRHEGQAFAVIDPQGSVRRIPIDPMK